MRSLFTTTRRRKELRLIFRHQNKVKKKGTTVLHNIETNSFQFLGTTSVTHNVVALLSVRPRILFTKLLEGIFKKCGAWGSTSSHAGPVLTHPHIQLYYLSHTLQYRTDIQGGNLTEERPIRSPVR